MTLSNPICIFSCSDQSEVDKVGEVSNFREPSAASGTGADGDETKSRDRAAERAEQRESLQREGLKLLEVSWPAKDLVGWGRVVEMGVAI